MMQVLSVLLSLLASTATAQTVYLIRHGEKPADGSNGLTAQGMQRAQCLRNVFGASSQYHIGYIIAEQPKSSKSPLFESPTSPDLPSPQPGLYIAFYPFNSRVWIYVNANQAARAPAL